MTEKTYLVQGYATGEWTHLIRATSEEEARAKMKEAIADPHWEPAIDCDSCEIEDVTERTIG